MKTMPLRRRLVLLVVGLGAVGLAGANTVAILLLRSSALGRVDRQLERGFRRPPQPTPRREIDTDALCRRPGGFQLAPDGTLTEFYDAAGRALCPSQSVNDPGGGPVLSATDLTRPAGTLFTVRGHQDGHSYRVAVSTEGDVTVARAIDLGEANGLWHDQALAVALVSAATLVAIGGAGFVLVRRGLRPLEAITATADAITKGERHLRVDVTTPGTEVGSLGTAFNAMLASIDEAFAEQRATEQRLRDFVADASHELRTPLTSIKGYAELQLSGGADSPEKLATSMRNIKREADRMTGLVEDLLLLARLDREPDLREQPVDLARLVTDAAGDLRAVDPNRPVTVCDGAMVRVVGDEARLRQVIGNLVANARTHTPAGSPIELTVAEQAGQAVVHVVDHGPGIPDEQADHVFERFARLDRSRARASGGTGLGLAIVKAIVTAHHGDVAVEPTPGGGATFVVTLPAG